MVLATPPPSLEQALALAARWVRSADGLLIGAGAGMGIDSGLPDFRGTTGFWRAYPPLAARGLAFEDVATPHLFETQPRLAWGFYGHRLALYRGTRPHEGFSILQRLASRLPEGLFVFTSNVDGQFQRAGVPADRVLEVHGSIHRLQCTVPCRDVAWPADELEPEVDAQQLEWTAPLPRCRHCGRLARPNILMFDDDAWVDPDGGQAARLDDWLGRASDAVVLEIGAGGAVPTVRRFCSRLRRRRVGINPDYAIAVSERRIDLPFGAREAARMLEHAVELA